MSSDLLNVRDLSKHFDGIKALDSFSCTLRSGEILGLIGPNGAGKTTLFNVISGFLRSDNGSIIYKENDITETPAHRIANLGISRTFQDLRLIRQISVLDNVLLCFRTQLGERLGNVFFNRRRSRDVEAANHGEALTLLKEAGLSQMTNYPAEDLSYGQQKLLTLVCCLAAKSDVLLLDEPIAGIAPEMIEQILGIIRQLPLQGKAVILIEHNMDAVMQICDRVVFMDAGAKVSEGTPEEVRNDPKVIEAYID